MEDMVNRARQLAAQTLRDELRYDGTPFIQHPDGVARIVSDEIGLPEECVAAVYLHEATRIHPDVDVSIFPDDVLTIVDGLNKHKKAMRRTEKQAGGLIDKELPIKLCKLMPYDADKKCGTRVKTGEKEGKKARVSVKSGKAL